LDVKAVLWIAYSNPKLFVRFEKGLRAGVPSSHTKEHLTFGGWLDGSEDLI
jgi:hypothetical protein